MRFRPRKQRRTAHRICQPIRTEFPGSEVAESSVRRYVCEEKQAFGLIWRKRI